jgi:hypothetical protein
MTQGSLFDALREPPVKKAVDPDGPVVQGEVDEEHVLPHPKMAWDYARIQLHQDEDGLWMWGTYLTRDDGSGGGYRVGRKWGRFAVSRDDALFYAGEEIRDRIRRRPTHCKSEAKVLAWLDGLQ